MIATQAASAQVDKLEARINRINALLGAKLGSSKSLSTKKKPAQAATQAAPVNVEDLVINNARWESYRCSGNYYQSALRYVLWQLRSEFNKIFPDHRYEDRWFYKETAKYWTQHLAQVTSKLLNDALNKCPLSIFKYLPKNVSSILLNARTEGKFKYDDWLEQIAIESQIMVYYDDEGNEQISCGNLDVFEWYCNELMRVLDDYSTKGRTDSILYYHKQRS